MSRKKPPAPPQPPARAKTRRERAVTPEEASLWAQVAASIGPAMKVKARVRAVADRPAPEPPAPPAVRAEGAPPSKSQPARVLQKPPPAPPARPKPPPIAEFDRRKVRHIASGKIEIDARLDLHGLRQGEARQRLVGFIHSAHQRGLRTVLVITGKGSGAGSDPLAGALGEPQRGVLRRLVPQWLDGPELRLFIVSFTTASIRHGGEGALYVRLRRADRLTSA